LRDNFGGLVLLALPLIKWVEFGGSDQLSPAVSMRGLAVIHLRFNLAEIT